MYMVLFDSQTEEVFEYLFDAEDLAAELPGSIIINLETLEEEGE